MADNSGKVKNGAYTLMRSRLSKSQPHGEDNSLGSYAKNGKQKGPFRAPNFKPHSTAAALKQTNQQFSNMSLNERDKKSGSQEASVDMNQSPSTESSSTALVARENTVDTIPGDVAIASATERAVAPRAADHITRSKSVSQLGEASSKPNGALKRTGKFSSGKNGVSSTTTFSRKPAATNVRQPPRRAFGSASKNGEVGSLDELVSAIQSNRITRIIVMCGAGISTASGIPDFRSPGTGLYSNLQKYNLPYPEAIFDIDYFQQNPKPFFTLAKELFPSGKYVPNAVHHFFKLLYDQNRLLRIYTQNIDGLERMAGVPPSMIVEAHGTFATATCTYCLARYAGDEIREDVFAGRIPHCRNSESCSGVIKPDIVFFGEDLPVKFYSYLRDFLQADALFVLGTSLGVEPFASILNAVRFGVPRVLFNREAVGPFASRARPHDLTLLGDLVPTVTSFCDSLGWRTQLDALLSAAPSAEELSKRFFVHEPRPPRPPPASNSRNGLSTTPTRSFGSRARPPRNASDAMLPAIGTVTRNRPVSTYTTAKTTPPKRTLQRFKPGGSQPAINKWLWRQDTRLTYESDESEESESDTSESDDS